MEQDVIPAMERASARRNRKSADEGKGWRMNGVRLLFASFCFFFAEKAAFAQRVEFVPAGPQVIAESCRFEAPTSADCIAPNGDEALIHFPEALNKVIQEHIGAAKAAGYFDELSLDDLFHGHALLATAQTTFATPGEYFSRISAIVYHSAEYNNRWLLGDRRPRSFIGRTDGSHSVRPAIDLIPKGLPLRGYERSGTVYQDEVGKAHPELSGLKYDAWGRAPALTVGLCFGGRCGCVLEDMVYIVHEPDDRLDVYVRCTFASPDGVLESRVVTRPTPELTQLP